MLRSSKCNDVGRRRRWWRWAPTSVSIPRCQARKPTPMPPLFSFLCLQPPPPPGRPCRLTQPSLSHPPSSAHLQSRRTALPSSLVSLPSDGQLSRYELTELPELLHRSSFELCGLPTCERLCGFAPCVNARSSVRAVCVSYIFAFLRRFVRFE